METLFILSVIQYIIVFLGLGYMVYLLGQAKKTGEKVYRRKAGTIMLLTIALVTLIALIEWSILLISMKF